MERRALLGGRAMILKKLDTFYKQRKTRKIVDKQSKVMSDIVNMTGTKLKQAEVQKMLKCQ